MAQEVRLLGIAGSLSAASRNRAALETLSRRMPAGTALTLHDLAGVPLYNADLDGDAPPAAVTALKAAITEADALIFASPEYNYGVPGVLKNAIDWASRPAFRSPLAGKPVALFTVSPATTGGVRAQRDLKYVLTGTLSLLIPHKEVAIAAAAEKITDGVLVDEASLAALDRLVADVLAFLRRLG